MNGRNEANHSSTADEIAVSGLSAGSASFDDNSSTSIANGISAKGDTPWSNDTDTRPQYRKLSPLCAEAPISHAVRLSLNQEMSFVNNRLQFRLEQLEAVNRDLSELLSDAEIATLLLDTECKVRCYTPSSAQLFSITDTDIGQPIGNIPHLFISDDLTEAVTAVIRSEIAQDAEIQTRDGRWYARRILPNYGDNHGTGGAVVTLFNITSLKQEEQTLVCSERRFRTLYHDSPSVCFIVDIHGIILSVNRFGAEQLGFANEELEGASFSGLHPPTTEEIKRRILQCFAMPEKVQRWEAELPLHDGGTLWTRVSAHVVAHADAKSVLIISCEDISVEKQLEQELLHRATHDSMTGLVNRYQFEKHLEILVRNASISGAEHVLLFLDLDRFKVINESLGHHAGDELLCQIAQLISSQVCRQDMVARLGGDEFGVLLEYCSNEDGLCLAQKLAKALKGLHWAWKGHRITTGVGIGMVPITATSGDAASLVRAADHACYISKETGRNHVYVYHEDDPAIQRRIADMNWAQRIDTALEQDRVELYCQTIEPLQAGNAAGFQSEILLRLITEDGRQVVAGEFIPALERFGQCSQLDRWVIANTLASLSRHPDSLARVGLCIVNLSAQSLSRSDFADFVRDDLRRNEVSASVLCFKITEAAAIGKLDQTEQLIRSLRALGCRFVLAEFGNSFTSFQHLQRLSVDYVEIPRQFTNDIVSNPTHRAMVKWINEVSQTMGKKTIAEAVEKTVILDTLRALGVDYAQGYALGRPQPLTKALDALRSATDQSTRP